MLLCSVIVFAKCAEICVLCIRVCINCFFPLKSRDLLRIETGEMICKKGLRPTSLLRFPWSHIIYAEYSSPENHKIHIGRDLTMMPEFKIHTYTRRNTPTPAFSASPPYLIGYTPTRSHSNPHFPTLRELAYYTTVQSLAP